jgi:hypothetical protein
MFVALFARKTFLSGIGIGQLLFTWHLAAFAWFDPAFQQGRLTIASAFQASQRDSPPSLQKRVAAGLR